MRWIAIVPVRSFSLGKTRLSCALAEEERARLVKHLFSHVTNILRSVPAIADVVVLSESQPSNWQGSWVADRARGLNFELQAAVADIAKSALLVVHADLPLLSKADVDAFLAAAQAGCAIAPDRHGTGTNALALKQAADFSFAFGPDSFSKHVAATKGRARVVRRTGLSLDIDTPDDLAAAIAEGFRLD